MPRELDLVEATKERARRSNGRGLLARGGWFAVVVLASACGWDPRRPFDRDAPAVREAMGELDAGQPAAAAQTLETYLSTGPCTEGNIGAPDALKKRADGTFDLGLSLFGIAETFGRRFGEEEVDAGSEDGVKAQRTANVECALRVVRAVGEDETQALDLRARARYLEGNLLFLDGRYEDAVKAYDRSLSIEPGQHDAGDPVGRDAAFNRAIALRRIEDKKDAGNDAAPPDASDSPPDASQDSGDNKPDAGDGGGEDGGGGDGGKDGGSDGSGPRPNEPDGGKGDEDGGSEPPDASPSAPPDAGPPPPPKASQDERILDMLENAPTVQQEDAKRRARRRRVRGMDDK